MIRMLKYAAMSSLFLAPQIASASSPLTTCYVNAENSNQGLSFVLSVNGTTAATTTDISQVAQFTARFHDNATMSIAANSAGESAVKDALNCMLDQDVVTLSGFYLNEMSPFRVRTNALSEGNEVYDLFGVFEPGNGHRYLKFTSQTAFNARSIQLTDFGSFDGYFPLDLGLTVTGCDDPGHCGDNCLEECLPNDPDSLGCSCGSGGGPCTVVFKTPDAESASSIIQLN